jgi:hypothetical protein
MKIKSVGSKLLTNKIVLHIVFVIAFFNIICFIMFGKLDALILFILIAIIVGNFSRNMILVLGVPIIFVNIFMMKEACFRLNRQEGFEDGVSKNNSDEKNSIPDTNKKAVANSDETKPVENKSASESTTEATANSTKNNNSKNKPKIDYSTTVEEAYDNLNNIIGGEGMKNLTKDTQKLVQQQQQLTEAMKSMGPLMESMGPLMQTAQQIVGGGGLEGLADMANKFAPKPN